MKIKITKHAEDRMRKYGLGKVLLIKAVLDPDCIVKGKFGRKIAQKTLDERYLLRVVFEEKGEQLIVVTCYKARRERYEC